MSTLKRKSQPQIPDILFDALLDLAPNYGFSSCDIASASKDDALMHRLAALIGGIWTSYPVEIDPTFTPQDLLTSLRFLNYGLAPQDVASIFRADHCKKKQTRQLSLFRQSECKLHGLQRLISRAHLRPATLREFLIFLLAHKHEVNSHPLYTFGSPIDTLMPNSGNQPTRVVVIASQTDGGKYCIEPFRVPGLETITFPGILYRDKHIGCLVTAPLT